MSYLVKRYGRGGAGRADSRQAVAVAYHAATLEDAWAFIRAMRDRDRWRRSRRRAYWIEQAGAPATRRRAFVRLAVTGLAVVVAIACEYNFNLTAPSPPNINVSSTNTNENNNDNENRSETNNDNRPSDTNTIPTIPPTSDIPPTGQVLPLPTYGQGIVQQVAAANPQAVLQSCENVYGASAWTFLDKVVDALRLQDLRWGYLCLDLFCSSVSGEHVAYKATSTTAGVWKVDVIGNYCNSVGPVPTAQWIPAPFDVSALWGTRGRF
jgi:hypothetical protein